MQIDPPAFALVGMAAVLAGAVHAPLTAIILLFEMTNDYRIILPLMFTVVISLLISRRIESNSVYQSACARKGIRLNRQGCRGARDGRGSGGDANQPRYDFGQRKPQSASDILLQTHHHGMPVVNRQGDLVGIFTLQDLESVEPSDSAAQTVGEHCSEDLVVAFPDEKIGAAFPKEWLDKTWDGCRWSMPTGSTSFWACCAAPTWCTLMKLH